MLDVEKQTSFLTKYNKRILYPNDFRDTEFHLPFVELFSKIIEPARVLLQLCKDKGPVVQHFLPQTYFNYVNLSLLKTFPDNIMRNIHPKYLINITDFHKITAYDDSKQYIDNQEYSASRIDFEFKTPQSFRYKIGEPQNDESLDDRRKEFDVLTKVFAALIPDYSQPHFIIGVDMGDPTNYAFVQLLSPEYRIIKPSPIRILSDTGISNSRSITFGRDLYDTLPRNISAMQSIFANAYNLLNERCEID